MCARQAVGITRRQQGKAIGILQPMRLANGNIELVTAMYQGNQLVGITDAIIPTRGPSPRWAAVEAKRLIDEAFARDMLQEVECGCVKGAA